MKELLIRAALWTGDPARPRAQACVVRDGRFVFVGDFEAARAAYPAAEIADYGDNLASGHSAGIDMKLYGEFVPGTDSWITLSLMDTKMKLNGRSIPMPTDQRYALNFF